MTGRPSVLAAVSTPDPNALSSVASCEAEVLLEELAEAVRALTAALENAMIAQQRFMTETDPPEAAPFPPGAADQRLNHARRP